MSRSALEILGQDVVFPNHIAGLPARLSDFAELQIQHVTTSDGVRLAYWEAGEGEPLVILPGWSGSGADFINVLYLLRSTYHVYVLDPRNQGLSDRVSYGARIARMAAERAMAVDSPFYQNSVSFAQAVIKPDVGAIRLVLFDHDLIAFLAR
jgi:non-heme chloroperoxidase